MSIKRQIKKSVTKRKSELIRLENRFKKFYPVLDAIIPDCIVDKN